MSIIDMGLFVCLMAHGPRVDGSFRDVQSNVLAALLSSVPSIHIQLLKTVWNGSTGKSETFFLHP